MDLTDQTLNNVMDEFEEDQAVNEAWNEYQRERALERQRVWQADFIQQAGGSINPNEPGRFVFDLQPISVDVNRRFGLLERRFQVNLRQEGNV